MGRPRTHASSRTWKRRARVSSRFAVMTQNVAVRLYPGASDSKCLHAFRFFRSVSRKDGARGQGDLGLEAGTARLLYGARTRRAPAPSSTFALELDHAR